MAEKTDLKFEQQDVDLFALLAAIDKKDYGYYSRLNDTQQKKVSLYILLKWISSVRGKGSVQQYYLYSVNYHANTYFFDPAIIKHPELQWMMLCAASPGMGSVRHEYIPQIKEKVTSLQDAATLTEIKTYFRKIYSKISDSDVMELSAEYVREQNKKALLAKAFPTLKITDIETLSAVITDDQLENFKSARGD